MKIFKKSVPAPHNRRETGAGSKIRTKTSKLFSHGERQEELPKIEFEKVYKQIINMDIDLLSKIVKEIILDKDEVSLPGLGSFIAELVPSVFSDKGYTINPPYKRLYFRQKENPQDTSLIDFYASSNKIEKQIASDIVCDFLRELRKVLEVKKTIIFPGLGRLRATKENYFFFVADENLDIYPEGFGLEPISLKTHEETTSEVSNTMATLRAILSPEEDANEPAQVKVNAEVKVNADVTEGVAVENSHPAEAAENITVETTKSTTDGITTEIVAANTEEVTINSAASGGTGKATAGTTGSTTSKETGKATAGTAGSATSEVNGTEIAETAGIATTNGAEETATGRTSDSATIERTNVSTEETSENTAGSATSKEAGKATAGTAGSATSEVNGTISENANTGVTVDVTESATDGVAEVVTGGTAIGAVANINEKASENANESVTGGATEGATKNAVETITDAANECASASVTEEVSENTDNGATAKVKQNAGEDATESAAENATGDATENRTGDATGRSTESLTETIAAAGTQAKNVTTALTETMATSAMEGKTGAVNESRDKKKSIRKTIGWTIIVLAALTLTALAAFMILAHTAPDFIDSILYTPEELEIINR